MPPEQIDRKFEQAGWSLDPNTCPDCKTSAVQEKSDMAIKPTPASIKAQALMFNLLSTHFDPDAGAYAAGWTDDKIATETGLAPDLIREFRREAFGEIKESAAIVAIRADINALDQLAREHISTVSQEIASLRGRLAKLATPA